ncbi:sensor histidine kinase [Paludibaculum fermentans]|uniref:sensor histidine kinase n=1 Tax=Paludibaculum fermentans TaxID=1473598 RepID=UPI003EBBFC69
MSIWGRRLGVWGTVLRSLAGIALVLLVSAVARLGFGVNATTVGFAFLIVVLGLATAWGLHEAVVASVAAMLCFNFFFLPPVGLFTIADPQNWVALCAFLATALVASHLSNRAKMQAVEARERQQETERLYSFSRSILLTDTSQPVGQQAARFIAQTFECPAVALYDSAEGEVYRGGAGDLPAIDDQLKRVALDGVRTSDPSRLLMILPITLGGRPIGSVAMLGLCCSDGAMEALVNLVAIALERARSAEIASKAEAARQSEEFKSTLLDAIAHEFKTPLTSIKAASTSILSEPERVAPDIREFTEIIDEETDRLTLLVNEAVRMSQIEAGKVLVEKQAQHVPSFLAHVLSTFQSRLEGRTAVVEAADDLPPVRFDPDLISLALRQLIDNALKYSPPETPIRLTAAVAGGAMEIRVIDAGKGIPEKEREKVFQVYYRRNTSKGTVPGTGLGLHIAREILKAHNGSLHVEGAAGAGAEFCLRLPLEEARV